MPEIAAKPITRLSPLSSFGRLWNGYAKEKHRVSSGLESHTLPARPLPEVCWWAIRATGSINSPARQRANKSSLVDLVVATRSRMQFGLIFLL